MTDTVDTRELATIKSDPHVAEFQGRLDPSDETLKLRGGAAGVALYDEIRRDPHAHAVLQKRKLEVVSREWSVFPASEKRIDKKAAELVESQLKAINFDGLTRGLMGAVLKGYAVAEVLWALIDGVWTVAAVKVRRQRRFRFTVDGDLRLITRSNQTDGEAVPDRKFIVHRYSIDDDDDDPYGVGLGSVLYWPAWFKRQALAHWLRATERFAAPTTDIAYEGAYDEKVQKQMLAAARAIATDGVMAHPSNVKVQLLQAAAGGGGAVLESINRYLDETMSEAVLGETLSTNSGERGARSLGEVHNEVRIAIAKADADLVSMTIKNTLVRWIVELNLPGAQVPDVWRDFSEAEDLDKRSERDERLVGMGYEPKDEQYLNDTYGGEWVKRKAEKPAPEQPDPEINAPTAGETSALDTLFADRSEPEGDEVDALSDQLDTLAAPSIETMIEAVRAEVEAARSYDDLSTRLLRLSAELGLDEFGGLMEQANTVADLRGRANVLEEGGAGGG